MINSSNNTPRIGTPAYPEPVGPARHTALPSPSSEVQAPVSSKPSQESVDTPLNTDKVRKLGASESSPVKVSFQTPASASANAIQGVRRLSASEDIMAMPDLPSLDDLADAVENYQLALSALDQGAPWIAVDFHAWAKELDPGVPDLPPLTPPQP